MRFLLKKGVLCKGLHDPLELGFTIKAMARLLLLKAVPGVGKGHCKAIRVIEHLAC